MRHVWGEHNMILHSHRLLLFVFTWFLIMKRWSSFTGYHFVDWPQATASLVYTLPLSFSVHTFHIQRPQNVLHVFQTLSAASVLPFHCHDIAQTRVYLRIFFASLSFLLVMLLLS